MLFGSAGSGIVRAAARYLTEALEAVRWVWLSMSNRKSFVSSFATVVASFPQKVRDRADNPVFKLPLCIILNLSLLFPNHPDSGLSLAEFGWHKPRVRFVFSGFLDCFSLTSRRFLTSIPKLDEPLYVEENLDCRKLNVDGLELSRGSAS